MFGGEANPDTALCHCPQQCFLVNVHEFLIGSYLLPPWLSAPGICGGNASRIAAENPLGVQEIMWFQHDGAAAHLACQFRKDLTAI
jgi:hypothetical protein